jgi:hypothetical protein
MGDSFKLMLDMFSFGEGGYSDDRMRWNSEILQSV